MPASLPLPSTCQQHTGRSMVSADLANVGRDGFTRGMHMPGDILECLQPRNKMSPILSTLQKRYLFALSQVNLIHT